MIINEETWRSLVKQNWQIHEPLWLKLQFGRVNNAFLVVVCEVIEPKFLGLSESSTCKRVIVYDISYQAPLIPEDRGVPVHKGLLD